MTDLLCLLKNSLRIILSSAKSDLNRNLQTTAEFFKNHSAIQQILKYILLLISTLKQVLYVAKQHTKHRIYFLFIHNIAALCTAGPSQEGGGGGLPQFLAKHLTLSQPGGRLCPPQYYKPPPPPDFQTLRRPCVVYHVHVQCSFETYIIYVRQ